MGARRGDLSDRKEPPRQPLSSQVREGAKAPDHTAEGVQISNTGGGDRWGWRAGVADRGEGEQPVLFAGR